MLIADRAIVRRHPDTVIRVLARLHLIDEVAHRERVFLRRAKNKGLLLLVDGVHEQFHAVFFALLISMTRLKSSSVYRLPSSTSPSTNWSSAV